MDTLEKVALGVLAIVTLIVILQRGSSAAQIVNAIGGQFGGIVKTLTTAPK